MIPEKDILDEVRFPILIGDIGGTNSRFALIETIDSPLRRMPDAKTDDYATIEDAIEAAVYARTTVRPRSAIVALAGPIDGERIDLTNAAWVVEPRNVIARAGLEEMILLNDFEAVSLALPDLTPDDVEPIGEVRWQDGTRVAVGPGTGLGVAGVVRGRTAWIAVPGEGGHIDMGPVSPRDFEIWPHLERVEGRITSEALVSGAGLVRVYRAICASDGVPPTLNLPQEITEAGLNDGDAQSAETVALFATYLGRMAGDLALIFMARGGVFLAGGISAKIAPLLHSGVFRAAFLDKEPHRDLLETIPTAIITKTDPALAGIAAFARTPDRFVVDLGGRRWRASL